MLIKKHYRVFLAFLAIILPFLSCRNDIITENTPENVFLAFWQTLDENYVYFEEKGVDWNAVYYEYYPQAKAAKTDEDLYNILWEMKLLLNDHHVGLMTWSRDSSYYFFPTNYYQEDSTTFKNEFFEEKYDFVPRFFRFSYPYTCWQHKSKNYAYIEVESFGIEDFTANKTKSEDIFVYLEKLDYSDGLIIDIRNNGGGFGLYGNFITSLFYTGEKTLFSIAFKNGKGHSEFGEKTPYLFKGQGLVSDKIPVVVLTAKNTYSAGNYFAYQMNDLPNCTLIGEQTGGGGGAITTVVLPNKWIMTYPFFRGFSSQGANMEFGIMPDVFVSQNYDCNQPNVKDAVILRALEFLDSINNL
ncbi:MAG: S41 family peptidase [Paludibacter sp.]|jgi:hypothetical protein|nr:S41 family peptidase [Paludibacter sp.]